MTTPIFLDLTALETKSAQRGIGRYVRGLVQGLAEIGLEGMQGLSLSGFSTAVGARGLRVVPDVIEHVRRHGRLTEPVSYSRRDWLVGLRLRALPTPRDAWIHLAEPAGLPWLDPKRPTTLTCLDVISMALPELYLPKLPKWDRVHAAVERAKYGRPRRILAISHATRRDLVERVGIAPSRIDVVWPGVDLDRFRPDPELGEEEHVASVLGTRAPFVLYIGAGDPRKDLETLVTAFGISRARKEGHLVVAGAHPEKRATRLRDLRDGLGLRDVVHLPGYLDEAIVPALYRRSRVHVFPSLYEGFGLPVIEALACGTPTITSPGSSLPEVAGDAARMIPCGDPEALAASIDELWFDETRRADARVRGLAHARSFTWRRCAEQTVAFWQKSISG